MENLSSFSRGEEIQGSSRMQKLRKAQEDLEERLKSVQKELSELGEEEYEPTEQDRRNISVFFLGNSGADATWDQLKDEYQRADDDTLANMPREYEKIMDNLLNPPRKK